MSSSDAGSKTSKAGPGAPSAADMMAAPFVLARVAAELAMGASVSVARVAQIAMQSADTALAKYIELTEQEMRRGQRRESVKVE